MKKSRSYCLILFFWVNMAVSNEADGFCKIIAFEGMPGAGKTTALLSFAHEFEGKYIVLSEMNPEPDSPWKHASIKEQGEIFHQLWVERIQSLRKFHSTKVSFLLDRSYISNLAFSYALDKFKGTDYYSAHKAAVARDLDINADFSSVIVLDVTPECCLERRKRAGDIIPWPWSEKAFLDALRQFYQEELPKFCMKVIYINTDQMSSEQVKQQLRKHINSTEDKSILLVEQKAVAPEEIEMLLKFAKQYLLGEIQSLPLRVFDCPTIYFRKHSIQLDNEGNPRFFNNERLKELGEIDESQKDQGSMLGCK